MLAFELFICVLLLIEPMIILCKDDGKNQRKSEFGASVSSHKYHISFNEKSVWYEQTYHGVIAFSAVRAHTRSRPLNYDIEHVRFDRTLSNIGEGWNPIDSNFQ